MRAFNGACYISLLGLALYGLYRLFMVQASFTWFLATLYIVVATLMLVVNSVRYGYRKWTPDPTDDHAIDIVTRKWVFVALLSTIYGALATIINVVVRHSYWLATPYAIATVVCLVISVMAVLVARFAKKHFAAKKRSAAAV